MNVLKTVLFLGLAFSVTACVKPEAATRSAAQTSAVTVATQNSSAGSALGDQVAIPLNVVAVKVLVPSTLTVSEADSYLPVADVVWRGEPKANRLEQVYRIFTEAAAGGTGGLKSGLPVIAEIEVTRFHSVTEKTRNSIGGNHAMRFMLTVRHAETGEILDGPRPVKADVKASGGTKAIAEDYAGRTQRVVVVERLTEVIFGELKSLKVNPSDFGLAVSRSVTNPATIVVSSMN